MSRVITIDDMRLDEIEVLCCRIVSDLNRLARDLDEIAAASRDTELTSRDPDYVADNLRGIVSPLLRFDVQRVRALALALGR